MKKRIWCLLAFALIACIPSAYASSNIPAVLKRDIKIIKNDKPNPLIAGESPTTGLSSDNKLYFPILTQIDNNLGAIPQWGIAQADIIYELPIAGQGLTRLTALFSDQYPQEAGPVRSIRVMHVDLREEWDAVLIHWGKQTVKGSNVDEQLSKYKVKSKGLAIDGIGLKYEDYLKRVRYHPAPHNASAHINDIKNMLLSLNYNFPVRPFKFSDNMNYGGEPARKIHIEHKKNQDTSSTFIYNDSLNGYQRFIINGPYFDMFEPETELVYSNLIVQRTNLSFNGSSLNPLLPDVVGEGAADIFIAGQYVPGAWSRDSANERTVFYDQTGHELSFQRGKSWIIICDESTEIVLYDADFSDFKVSDYGAIGITTPGPEDEQVTDVQDKEIGILEEAYYAIVRVAGKGQLNMREEASKQSNLITRISHGTRIQVINRDEEWSKIEYGKREGYVMSSYLEFLENDE